MISHLKAEIRRLRVFLHREHQRGHGVARAILLQLPRAATAKLYGKVARLVNGRLLTRYFSRPRFRAFHRHVCPDFCLYIIVMPDVMHFLIPCLRLIPTSVPVVLLYNGASSWEREYLRGKFPDFPAFRLWTLPRSSVPHGDVLTLLLREHDSSFGILDHDVYLFDGTVFDRLTLNNREYALGIWGEHSARTGIDYPLTPFLVLNAPILRALMDRYGVDARLYRKPPRRLQTRFDAIGLKPGVYLKDYHNFFDTLNVLFALAHAEGLRARQITLAEPRSAYHIGGTSIGDPRTRDLVEQYTQQLFLERIGDPVLYQHYENLHDEFPSSEAIRNRLAGTPRVLQTLEILAELMGRLEASRNSRALP